MTHYGGQDESNIQFLTRFDMYLTEALNVILTDFKMSKLFEFLPTHQRPMTELAIGASWTSNQNVFFLS